jgi:DNA polymerase III alpha subunit
MKFAQAAREHGIQPIIGAEVTFDEGYHLTLLAETARGYANLCRLLTHANLNSPRGSRASATTGCLSTRKASSRSPAAAKARSPLSSRAASYTRPERQLDATATSSAVKASSLSSRTTWSMRISPVMRAWSPWPGTYSSRS